MLTRCLLVCCAGEGREGRETSRRSSGRLPRTTYERAAALCPGRGAKEKKGGKGSFITLPRCPDTAGIPVIALARLPPQNMLSFVVSQTALTGGPKAFPKLSPQTSTLRIHTTFDDASASTKLSKDCAAAALKPKACQSRGGNIKMQAVAAGSETMSVAQACAFMQDPALSDMSVEAKLEFLASKGVDPFVASQASCTSLGDYAAFGPVIGVDGTSAAPAAAAPAAAPAPSKAKHAPRPNPDPRPRPRPRPDRGTAH